MSSKLCKNPVRVVSKCLKQIFEEGNSCEIVNPKNSFGEITLDAPV